MVFYIILKTAAALDYAHKVELKPVSVATACSPRYQPAKYFDFKTRRYQDYGFWYCQSRHQAYTNAARKDSG